MVDILGDERARAQINADYLRDVSACDPSDQKALNAADRRRDERMKALNDKGAGSDG